MYHARWHNELRVPGVLDNIFAAPNITPAVINQAMPAIADLSANPDGSRRVVPE